MSGHISALSETVMSECFAAQSANLTVGWNFHPIFVTGGYKVTIKLYEVNPYYIDYLVPYAPHLFQNKQPGQYNERKYIGVVLSIQNMNYFAPLSSFKPKHEKMKNGLDFIKIGNYAVININNMLPVPEGEFAYVDIPSVKDIQYRKLLQTEYRIIRKMQDKIRNQAAEVYKHKMKQGNATALAKRCNDFLLLEEKCKQFMTKRSDYENRHL